MRSFSVFVDEYSDEFYKLGQEGTNQKVQTQCLSRWEALERLGGNSGPIETFLHPDNSVIQLAEEGKTLPRSHHQSVTQSVLAINVVSKVYVWLHWSGSLLTSH